MKLDEQIKAWAIDRAIETLKVGGNPVKGADVITLAGEYAEWTTVQAPDLDTDLATSETANEEAA